MTADDGAAMEQQRPAPEVHDTDRAMPELLQELRVAQTGGQIFFAFLFTVAFTPVFAGADSTQRAIYGADLFAVAAAIAFLVSPVAVHRANFGRRVRPQLLIVFHVTTIIGLALLAFGVVLGVLLISTFVFPGEVPWLAVGCGAVLLLCWGALPLAVRLRTHPGQR